jgi:ech hydrogenase subunit A
LENTLLASIIVVPIAFGLLALVLPVKGLRYAAVLLGALATAAVGVQTVLHGSFIVESGKALTMASTVLEIAIVLAVFGIAIHLRSVIIALLALVQLGLAVAGEIVPHPAPASEHAAFVFDPLAAILVLIVSLLGAIIVIYAIGYMRKHTDHAPATAAGEGRFFFFLIGFLGAMNGLAVANDLRWLAVFWEATTLCSFILIGHDGTPEARKNAKRALLINTFGGAALGAASLIALMTDGSESLSGVSAGIMLLPMALLALAAFTKSAQLPFQSWLLGAMVAPTPVSALLHSATMVNAGVYVLIRLAPAFAGTKLSYVIALAGAFTFAVTAILAIGQSNGKRVLAYSTISNLGLIVACVGLNTPLAYAAAVMILVFHAASKGLLFMCMGTIEQAIGSRDIEDMGSLMFRMPMTTIIMVVGMVSMLAPPLGLLLGKWMAIEASVGSPLILVLLVIGSAVTVLFWAKWLGRIQTVSYHERYQIENLPASVRWTQMLLVAGVAAVGILAVPIYNNVMQPLPQAVYATAGLPASSWQLLRAAGEFMVWPILACMGLALLAHLFTFRHLTAARVSTPFLCGENVEDAPLSYTFHGAMDKPETAWAASYYLRSTFTEPTVTFWANLLAMLLALTMFGVVGVI